MSRLVLALLLAVMALGGCSSTMLITDAHRIPHLVSTSGLDLRRMDQVLYQGFSQIETRALEKPVLEPLFLAGLNGMSRLDAKLVFRTQDANVVGLYGEQLFLVLPKPEPDV